MSERVTMELTAEEAKRITDERAQRERRRWIVEGMFLAASYLNDLGNECAGGSGDQTNPATGERYGKPYYDMSDILTRRAAYLSSNPNEINA